MDKASQTTTTSTSRLRALGFCGVDDSVDPRLLALIAWSYPLVEFGVLFRPDRQGSPRYASQLWVEEWAKLVRRNPGMKAAAHLCGTHVNDVLNGDTALLVPQLVSEYGFSRIQINATAVNGVDTSKLADQVPIFLSSVVAKYPNVEFILQKNEETRPLWEGIVNRKNRPSNISLLLDESKGTGMMAETWHIPPAAETFEIGFAGGIGPSNIDQVLKTILAATDATNHPLEPRRSSSFWIDMESSLRSTKNGQDIFDVDKCFQIISATCRAGLMHHPPELA